MNTRILTISSFSAYNYKQVPCIRLQGKWLHELGFEIGRKIEVEESENLIVIKLVAKEKKYNIEQI